MLLLGSPGGVVAPPVKPAVIDLTKDHPSPKKKRKRSKAAPPQKPVDDARKPAAKKQRRKQHTEELEPVAIKLRNNIATKAYERLSVDAKKFRKGKEAEKKRLRDEEKRSS